MLVEAAGRSAAFRYVSAVVLYTEALHRLDGAANDDQFGGFIFDGSHGRGRSF